MYVITCRHMEPEGLMSDMICTIYSIDRLTSLHSYDTPGMIES